MRYRSGPILKLVLASALALALAGAAGAALRQAQHGAADVTLNVYLGGNGTGSVRIDPPGLSCQDDCRATVAEGTTVKVTATAAAGSALDAWPGNQCQEQGSALEYTGPTCTVKMDFNKSVFVTFTKVDLNVYLGGNGSGSVTSSPPGIDCTDDCKASFALGTKVTLTAKAAAGSALDNWPNGQCQEQGSKLSYLGPTCTIVMDANKSAFVTFTKVDLNVYLSGSGKGSVSISPGGQTCSANCKATFAKGEKVTLTARPAAGSSVANWSNGQCEEQGNALEYKGTTCTILMDSNKSAFVTFQPGAATPPPSGGGGGPTIGSSAPPPPPKPGVAVNVESEGGTTLVKLPGTSTFRRLVGGAQVPVGSVVDATKGKMGMTSSGGSSDFSKGAFVVREPRVAGARVTALALTGGNFAACPKAKKTKKAKRKTASVEAAAPKVVRQLLGNGKGRFRTSGRFAAATVRGTTWIVQDRCDGTLVRVTRGTVAVLDVKRKRTVLVKAGKSYLAKR